MAEGVKLTGVREGATMAGVTSSDLMTPSGAKVTKVEAFGWTVIDRPGRHEDIDKAALSVDHAYQRDRINNKKVNEIASGWSWVRCNTLRVASRPDGTRWVIDGQHRLLAARKRADITTLPCMVYESAGVAKEAADFVGCDKVRTNLSSYATWKAAKAAGDADALAVEQVISSAGYRAEESSDSNCTVIAVAELMRQQKQNPAVFRRIFPLCADVCRPRQITRRLLAALFRLELYMVSSGAGSICEQPHAGRLVEAGPDRLTAEMDRRAAQVGKTGAKTWADGILARVINHGRRVKIPSLFLTDSGDS